MSMLLDALRKSEKRQRARTVPDIHAEAAEPAEAGRGPGRLLWPALALTSLILVAAAAAWYWWPLANDGMPANPASAGPGDGAKAQQTAGKQPGSASAGPRRKPSSPVETLAQSEPAGSGAGPAPLSEAERKAQRVAEREARRKAERQAARRAKREAARQAQQQAAAPGQQSPPARQSAQREPKARQSAQQVPETDGVAGAAEARPAAADPAEPQPISYWELPGAVRNQLPEMKISVLVFAEQPADRFVLMNGQRLAEGDQLQDGLTLQEVRRDGAVMRFKMYRFLVSHN